jgi:hypothetical protein
VKSLTPITGIELPAGQVDANGGGGYPVDVSAEGGVRRPTVKSALDWFTGRVLVEFDMRLATER